MHKVSDNRQYSLILHEDVLLVCPVSCLLKHLENVKKIFYILLCIRGNLHRQSRMTACVRIVSDPLCQKA